MALDKNKIYGELSTLGVLQLIEDIKTYHKPSDLFLDIGSGYGKCVRTLAEVGGVYAMGIEIDRKKYNTCMQINYTPCKDKISFQEGDIIDNKHLLEKADIIFMNNVTWDKGLTDFVFENSKNKIVYFFSQGNKRFDKIYQIPVQVSWKKDPITLYKTNTNTIR